MKFCYTCRREKPLEDFNLYKRSKDGRQDRCRQCQKDWYKAHATSHKQNTARHKKLHVLRNQKHVWEYLLEHPCVDCGENDPVVLDFDHVRDEKLDNVSYIAASAFKLQILIDEIAKCEVRCANCHRRKTAKQFRWYAWLDN